MSIDFFQARFAFVNTDDGTLTPEAFRVLRTWFKTIGGFDSTSNEDLEQLALQTFVPDVTAQSDIADLQLNYPIDQSAQLAALASRCDELQGQLAILNNLSDEVAALRQHVSDIELTPTYRDQFRVDWERPGKIGSLTTNTGAFTTLTATTLATSDQISATKAYSIAPALKATTTAVNIASSFAATNSDASQFLVGYSGASTDPTQAIWWNAGQVLRFATATSAQAAGFTIVATLDASGFKSVAGFGCNGKTPQTAYALGGAATDLATVIALANNMRIMGINNGMGS